MNDIQILNTYSDVSSGVSLANYKQILTQWRGLRVNQPLILQIDGEHLDDQQVILLLILLKLFRIDLLDKNMIILITDSPIKVIERQCRYQSSINNVKVSWLWCHIGLYAMHIGYNTLCGDYQVTDLQEYNVMEGLVYNCPNLIDLYNIQSLSKHKLISIGQFFASSKRQANAAKEIVMLYTMQVCVKQIILIIPSLKFCRFSNLTQLKLMVLCNKVLIMNYIQKQFKNIKINAHFNKIFPIVF
ncbi:Hypothetical_protein [Hexamita inflata]|uniref:Hypothetical_protein n=1 Tax=Hexamita inflata TaxID=28002 RepID=A0ABP1KZT0_9EUKA